MSSYIDVLLNSKNRNSGGTPESFAVELKNHFNNVKSVQFRSAIIPNTVYNVLSTYNKIRWTYNDGSNHATSYTVPVGSYDVDTLCTTIQTGMNADADTNTYTVSYSATTQKVTIARATGTNTFRLDWSSDTLFYQLGFENTASALDANDKTGDYCARLNNTYYLGIRINELNNRIVTSSGKLFSILLPIDGNTGTLLESNEGETGFTVTPVHDSLHKLTVTVDYANENDTFSLNGCDWAILLRFNICK